MHHCVFVCPETVPDPLDLKSRDVSTDSFRVSWQHPASDVVLYRLTWTHTDGGSSQEVCVWPRMNSLDENSSYSPELFILVPPLRFW